MAIFGAGAFGSWIALRAASAGFETILVDPHGPANKLSSSAGPTRIIRRAYGADEIYTLFAQRSLELWTEFFAAENRADCLRRTGVLWLANGADASIHAARGIFERRRIEHEFLEIPAIRALCPEMEPAAGSVALYEPECGALMAEESVRLAVDAAVRLGARYVEDRAKPAALHTKADIYVFACGSWLPGLFPKVLGSRIFPTRQEVFFFEPPIWPSGSTLPIWVDQTDARVPYGFPNIDGVGLKLAFHRNGPPFDPDSGDRQVQPEQIAEAAGYLKLRFPAMGRPVFRNAQVCHYENTSSGDLLIDRHPSMRNVWFAGGGSGHGFKHAPAVAEYLLEAIETGYSPEPRFRIESKRGQLARTVV